MSNQLVACWDESYSRFENNVLEPYEELVKFLARFVFDRKPDTGAISLKGQFSGLMTSDIEFIDIGCGVGAQSEHLARLGFKVKGFDVSDIAIKRARERCSRAKLQDNASFFTVNPSDFQVESSFDIAIACASLDSMPFDNATDWIQKAGSMIKENGLLFSTLIGPSSTNSALSEEVISNELHEKGTVQSYFNESKILKLLECGGFHPQRIDLIETTSIFPANKETRSTERYSVVACKTPARS